MTSHLSRLKAQLEEQLIAKNRVVQDHGETIESLNKVTEELQAQKQKLTEKLTESENHKQEMQVLHSRLDALVAAEGVINAAMHTKSGTENLVRHVVEKALRSDHLTASNIMQTTLDLSMHVNGRTRSDEISDFLFDSVDKKEVLIADIESAMEKFADANDVVKIVLQIALKQGSDVEHLRESVVEAVIAMLDKKEAMAKPVIDVGSFPDAMMKLAMKPEIKAEG